VKIRTLIAALALALSMPVIAEAASHHPEVAITVDDLPYAGATHTLTPADAATAREINRALLKAFARRHVPAIGFVNQRTAELIGADSGAQVLRTWTAPGFDLGNHLYSHPDVNKLTLVEAEDEILRGEPMIDAALARVGRKPRFLRFPYNQAGDTAEKRDAIAAFMVERGYRLAPCTIENQDYDFNPAYVLALSRHDAATAARIRAAYLDFTAAEIDWYTKIDTQVFGYSPPHVMLLHDSVLNRDAVDGVLKLFVARHYRFVSLGDAERDPAYATPEIVTKYGPMWGYRWAQALHVKVHGQDEPVMPAWVGEYARSGG
jgi:peptidoglycan/xylan/chitin deacetylase (PgdA/CDA1 family)